MLWDGESWGLSWSGERKTQGARRGRTTHPIFTSIQLILSLEGTQAGGGLTWKEQGAPRAGRENGLMSSPSGLPWTARTCPPKVRVSSGNSGFLSGRGAEARELAVERAIPAPSG